MLGSTRGCNGNHLELAASDIITCDEKFVAAESSTEVVPARQKQASENGSMQLHLTQELIVGMVFT